MKLTIARDELFKPLQIVSGVVEKKHAVPVLANVLLQCDGDELRITGSDLEVELSTKVPVTSGTRGETTVPGRKLLDICKALPEGSDVEIEVDEEKALIRSGRSRFSISALPASEFPATEISGNWDQVEIEQSALRELIEKTQFCMAHQDVRYYLNGLLLEVGEGKIKAVATDGHRLAIRQLERSDQAGEKRQVIVPRKAVNELGRILQDSDEMCAVEMSASQVRFKFSGIVMTAKLIDGKFPDYERVVPKDGKKVVVGDREEMRQALARAATLSSEKYKGVRIGLERGVMTAWVHNQEQEEAEEKLDVRYDGEEFEIGFNVNYLVEALSALPDNEVELVMNDSSSSCLIKGTSGIDIQYVVMPMRL